MELTLTPDIETAIKAQADQEGTTPEQLALEGLRKLFVQSANQTDEAETSLEDFLNGYIGVIHSGEQIEGGANMSEETGAKFTQLLVQKRDQDQL